MAANKTFSLSVWHTSILKERVPPMGLLKIKHLGKNGWRLSRTLGTDLGIPPEPGSALCHTVVPLAPAHTLKSFVCVKWSGTHAP